MFSSDMVWVDLCLVCRVPQRRFQRKAVHLFFLALMFELRVESVCAREESMVSSWMAWVSPYLVWVNPDSAVTVSALGCVSGVFALERGVFALETGVCAVEKRVWFRQIWCGIDP